MSMLKNGIKRRIVLGWILALSTLSFSNVIFSGDQRIISVPFANILLNPSGVIHANYFFGINSVIFCYENNQQTIGQIQWTFQGQLKTSSLPIFLKDNGNFEGEFADPSGNITITNTSTQTLVVSCHFGY